MRSVTRASAAALLITCWASPVLAQQDAYVLGQVIVLAEPGAMTLPPGLDRAPADRVQVAAARLREIIAERQISAVRRAVKSFPQRLPPEARVHARRKGELMPPDALADLSLLYVLEFPETTDVRALVAELNDAEGIVYAEPNYYTSPLRLRRSSARHRRPPLLALSPNDPLFVQGLNWGFYNSSQPAWDVNARDAWDIQTGNVGTKIAILDTGIERTHPDFGYGAKVAAEYDFVNDDPDAYPDLDIDKPGHGTAVAGVAAAQTSDAFGSAGLCGGYAPSNPGCPILAAKILGSLSIIQGIAEWLGLTDMSADGANWAVANGAKVINNSWCSSHENFTTHDAFRNAYLSGVLVTAAMGNTQGVCDQETPDEPVAPAAYSDILMAVGATNEGGQRITTALGYSWESAIGSHISVVAPGVNHHSDELGGGTAWFGGTSEATPFVSGLAGLIYSEAQDQRARPSQDKEVVCPQRLGL